jgi:hypothetical protein
LWGSSSASQGKEPGESAKLSSDGMRLDGMWMGGTGIAQWDKGHVYFNDLGSNAAAKVQKAVVKMAKPGVVVENSEVVMPRNPFGPANMRAPMREDWIEEAIVGTPPAMFDDGTSHARTELREASEVTYDDLQPKDQKLVDWLAELLNGAKIKQVFDGVFGRIVVFGMKSPRRLQKDELKKLAGKIRWLEFGETEPEVLVGF